MIFIDGGKFKICKKILFSLMIIFPINFFFFIVLLLFIFGLTGSFLIRRNLIMIIVCIELMLMSIQLNFIIYSYNFNDILGQFFVLFILMVAAAEVAIGLALLIVYYRLRGTIDTKYIYLSKG
jgi:NADH-quinone oxidoreductase subunit K